MNFVADESVDAAIVFKLRESKYNVFAVAEQCPGIEDDEVLKIAHKTKSILITQDKDFGELIYRLGKAHEGVILLRLPDLNTHQKADLNLNIINQHQHKLCGAFTVIYKDLVKIRHTQ